MSDVRSFSVLSSQDGASGEERERERERERGRRGTYYGLRCPSDQGESLIVIMWPKTNLDTAAECEQASEQAREQVSSADFRFNTANRNARRIC